MKRKFYDELLNWKENNLHVPLIVVGARQVGKTYIIDEFCKNNFKNYYYVNLMNEKEFVDYFDSLGSFDKRVEVLENFLHTSLKNNDDSILFVDEVQESEVFIESLKFFNESADDYNIVCAGSLLGVALRRMHCSFPVGKVIQKDMYPLDFEEFLWATNNEWYIDKIKKSFINNEPLLEIVHTKLLDLFFKYLYLGGMPQVINNFLENDMEVVRLNKNVIEQIIKAYFEDMKKYTDNKESVRITNLYSSIPSQLAKENQKFVFTQIDKEDKRKRDYVTALDWLYASRLVLSCNLVTKLEFPLKGFVDIDSFKLYWSDTGILNKLLNVPASSYILNKPFSFKEIVVENYVACELRKMEYDLFYWTRKGKNNGNAEIDFIIQHEMDVIPLEVKAGRNTQAKSLMVYNEMYKPELAIRISTNNFSKNGNIKEIPLYAVFCLKYLSECKDDLKVI